MLLQPEAYQCLDPIRGELEVQYYLPVKDLSHSLRRIEKHPIVPSKPHLKSIAVLGLILPQHLSRPCRQIEPLSNKRPLSRPRQVDLAMERVKKSNGNSDQNQTAACNGQYGITRW